MDVNSQWRDNHQTKSRVCAVYPLLLAFSWKWKFREQTTVTASFSQAGHVIKISV